MSRFEASRHARSPDGRFASMPPAPESGVDLTGPAAGMPEPDEAMLARWSAQPDPDAVASAGRVELDWYVRHPDWEVRLDSLRNPNVTAEQVAELADPNTQPVVVRLAAAHASGGHRAGTDPNPVVRLLAAEQGASLGAPDRAVERLSGLLAAG